MLFSYDSIQQKYYWNISDINIQSCSNEKIVDSQSSLTHWPHKNTLATQKIHIQNCTDLNYDYWQECSLITSDIMLWLW